MKPYKQLSFAEREILARLWKQKMSLRQIAKILNRHHSTLSRELTRNAFYKSFITHIYLPGPADIVSSCTRQKSKPPRVLAHPEINAYLREKIKLGWSPEQISGRLKIDKPGLSVSHEAIYGHIYKKAQELIRFLPRQHRWRKRRHRKRGVSFLIPNRIPITERPHEVQTKQEFGHWEADSMISRVNKVSLHVLLERKTRYTLITKLRRNNTACVRRAIKKRLFELPQLARRSITYDNGAENGSHELINKRLGTKSYFCSPYHFWEKGAVENTNGLIRRFIPKKTNLAQFTNDALKRIETSLNTRPRKCLNYQTPEEIFRSLSGALGG